MHVLISIYSGVEKILVLSSWIFILLKLSELTFEDEQVEAAAPSRALAKHETISSESGAETNKQQASSSSSSNSNWRRQCWKRLWRLQRHQCHQAKVLWNKLCPQVLRKEAGQLSTETPECQGWKPRAGPLRSLTGKQLLASLQVPRKVTPTGCTQWPRKGTEQ